MGAAGAASLAHGKRCVQLYGMRVRTDPFVGRRRSYFYLTQSAAREAVHESAETDKNEMRIKHERNYCSERPKKCDKKRNSSHVQRTRRWTRVSIASHFALQRSSLVCVHLSFHSRYLVRVRSKLHTLPVACPCVRRPWSKLHSQPLDIYAFRFNCIEFGVDSFRFLFR